MSEHKCCGFKPDGSPCRRTVKASFTYCYSHDPNTLEERRRHNSRAGKGNSQKELRQLKGKLRDLLDDVLEGKVDRGVAAVAANVSNALSRVYSVSLKARELETLEERLSELEEALERRAKEEEEEEKTGYGYPR